MDIDLIQIEKTLLKLYKNNNIYGLKIFNNESENIVFSFSFDNFKIKYNERKNIYKIFTFQIKSDLKDQNYYYDILKIENNHDGIFLDEGIINRHWEKVSIFLKAFDKFNIYNNLDDQLKKKDELKPVKRLKI